MGSPSTRILVNSREVQEANPLTLKRRINNAAILDFEVPRKAYLSLTGIGIGFRQGDIIELWAGQGTAQQRIFYGYLPSVTSSQRISEGDTILRFTAFDFIGQLQDCAVQLGADEVSVSPQASTSGGGSGSGSGGSPPPPGGGGGGGPGGGGGHSHPE